MIFIQVIQQALYFEYIHKSQQLSFVKLKIHYYSFSVFYDVLDGNSDSYTYVGNMESLVSIWPSVVKSQLYFGL